jgi:hypothetical protein
MKRRTKPLPNGRGSDWSRRGFDPSHDRKGVVVLGPLEPARL